MFKKILTPKIMIHTYNVTHIILKKVKKEKEEEEEEEVNNSMGKTC